MSKGLTNAERRKIERDGVVPLPLKKYEPSYHLCPEWDFMLICKYDPEFEACLCFSKILDERRK